MLCLATGRSSEAAEAFGNAATRVQDLECGSDSKSTCYHLFFSVLAMRQRKDMSGATLLPSRLVTLADDRSLHFQCECSFSREEASILVVDGFMQLAEMCDEQGSAPEANELKKNALEIFLGRFGELLDPMFVAPRFGWDLQIVNWPRRCHGHILSRQRSEIALDMGCEMFPYEAMCYRLYNRT